MATSFLAHGIDQLVLSQPLAFPRGVSHARRVTAVVSALESRGLTVTMDTPPTSLVARLALPRLNLRVFPVGPRGPYVDAHAEAEALVRDPRATVAAMRHALSVACGASTAGETGSPLGDVALRRVTCFVDACRWRLAPSTVRRFVARSRATQRLHFEHGRLTGVSFGKFFLCYDKTHEIRVHTSKAYIRDRWTANGYVPEWGTVWRFEFTLDQRHFPAAGTEPGTLWQYALDRVRLTRRANGSTAKDAQRFRFPLDPLWVALGRVEFPSLTNAGERIAPVVRSPATVEHKGRIAVGRLRSTLADLAVLFRVTAATAPDLAATVVRLIEQRDATFAADLLAAIQRRAASAGASPAA